MMVKNDTWMYVDGSSVKPEPTPTNAAVVEAWVKGARKAKSDLILSISSSELKQVKDCKTALEIWEKLESVYQSKGPARKASLLKKLTLSKMREGEDVRDHLNQFFDTVGKLEEMEVGVNEELLAILLLYSLPDSYENFRCAIETRDTLPKSDVLKVKILEEWEARRSKANDPQAGALYAKGRRGKQSVSEREPSEERHKKFRFKCFRCNKYGHKAAECRAPEPDATMWAGEETLL
jgi:hypothetical protein